MTTKQELESIKKQIATLEAKIAQEKKQEILTVEDAFNKLKPEWFLSASGYIYKIESEYSPFGNNKCNMTSKKEAKRIKALIQLRLIAEAMNEGMEEDNYWFINLDLKAIYSAIPKGSLARLIPLFKTEELANQALKNFKPLFLDLYAD
jgi:hypothetical protein